MLLVKEQTKQKEEKKIGEVSGLERERESQGKFEKSEAECRAMWFYVRFVCLFFFFLPTCFFKHFLFL